jgi:hypothetical protein
MGRSGTLSPGPTLSEVVRTPNVRRSGVVQACFTISELGSWIAITTVAHRFGGIDAAAAVLVAQLAPAALFAAAIGAIARRIGEQAVLRAGLVVQTWAFAALAVLLGRSAPTHWLVYAIAVVASVAVTTTRPMLSALLPALVDDPRQLAAGNAVLGWLEGFAALAGPAIAAVCFVIAGSWLAFAVFAAFTGVATLVSLRLHPYADAGSVDEAVHALEGTLHAVRNDSGIRAVLCATAACSFAMGALDLLYVVLAVDVLDGRDADVSWLGAVFGVGALVGGSVALTLVGGRGMWVRVVGAGGALGLALGLLGVGSGRVFVAIVLAVCGVMQALLMVSARTLLQRVTEVHLLTPVCAMAEASHMAMLMVGALVVPLFVDTLGARWAAAGVGFVVIAAIVPGSRAMARADTIANAWLGRIPQLHQTDAFAFVAGPALETLARQAEPRSFSAGQTIITQGDVGDSFYAITRGGVAISKDGEQIATRGPREGVGELALLYDVPRTATVTAIDAVEVLVIDRVTFLVAVSGFQPTWRRTLGDLVARYSDLDSVERAAGKSAAHESETSVPGSP